MTEASQSEDAAAATTSVAPHDRITQAYLGELGERFMQRTRRRIDWMCGQVRGRRVLDIGCSQGIVSLLLARAGHEVIGIDLDAKVVAEAEAYRASEPPEVRARVRFIHGDAADLAADGSFDTVVLGEILEHLEDPGWLIDIAAGKLAPGGRLVVTVPFGIHDFLDHRQTFYLSAPVALISRHFEVAEVEMIYRWVAFAAEKPAERGVPAGRPLDAASVPLLEEGVRQLECRLLDGQKALKQRLTRVGERLDQAQAQTDQLKRQLETVRTRVRDLEAEAERARVDARMARRRLEMVEESTSFRLGHALVLGAKSPRRLAGLTATAWRLWREPRSGGPGQVAPRPTLAALLEKLRHGPAHQLSVLEAVPPPGPQAVAPVAGRVVYVLHNSLPWSSGGYATRAHGLALGMQDAGLEVICLTRPGFPLDTKPELTVAALPLCDTIDGIDYRRLAAPLRTNVLARDYMLAAADAVEAELRRLRPASVIAASNYLTAMPGLIAARRLGLPFLYEVRGFWEVTRRSREPAFERSADHRVYEQMEAEVARRADHVFTLTGPMRDELVRRGVDPATISLLPNSCDPDRFAPRGRDAALAAHLGIPASVPVIGYIGTFVHYEGLEDLVAACAMLQRRGRDFRLMLIGNENVSGTEKGPITAEIERIAAETGLADRLIMPGRVPHDEVAAYYSLIDIAPFPRKPQPVTEMVSPMKPLEALAMEKAVVVSSVAALTEMIADEETGLVFAKGDIASLTDVLDRLIGDLGLRTRLGRNGRDWVVRQRTWTATAKAARDEIDRVVAQGAAPAAEGPDAIFQEVRAIYEARDRALGKVRFSKDDWERTRIAFDILHGVPRVADVGIGQAQLVNLLGRSPETRRVVGYDFRDYSTRIDPPASGRYAFRVWDVTGPLDPAPEPADVVVAMEVLEHIAVAEVPAVFDRLRAISPRGSILITVPYREKPPLYRHDRPTGHKQSFDDAKIAALFGPGCLYSDYRKKWYFVFAQDGLRAAKALDLPTFAARVRGLLR